MVCSGLSGLAALTKKDGGWTAVTDWMAVEQSRAAWTNHRSAVGDGMPCFRRVWADPGPIGVDRLQVLCRAERSDARGCM